MEVPLQVNLTIVGARDLPKTDFFSDIDPCTYSLPSPPLPSTSTHNIPILHHPPSHHTASQLIFITLTHHITTPHHTTLVPTLTVSPLITLTTPPHSTTLTHSHSLTLSDVTVTVAGGSHGKTEVMDNNANPTWDHELILLLNYNPTSHSLPSILFELWDKNSKSKDEKVYIYIHHTYIMNKEKRKKKNNLNYIKSYNTTTLYILIFILILFIKL